ncbi:MAG: peptidylprolyl isomerase [Burkholderiales bacterium PBB6]|nr:MAG: peptidylprolyl isomerase [Burkholderiales bacterium PBB6]
MFDFVRAHTRLLQGLLVLLIFPSFVFFGVQGYSSFTDKANSSVASIDGLSIKQSELEAAHRQQIERLRQQMPQADIKMFDTPEMKRQTLDALVRERVLMTSVVKDHLVISDTRLQRLFKTDPQYAALRDADGYVNQAFLAARGMSSEMFAEQLRQDYAMRQVLAGVTDTPLSGKTVTDGAVLALLDQRDVQLQKFDAKDYLAKVSPSDADIEAFYKSHTAQFRSPEDANIEFVVLDLAALKKQVTVSDDDLQKYYAENASRYTSQEERRASHILINAAKDAPAAEREKAKAKAEALLAEVRKAPTTFAAVAKKNSNDPGSADKGGDLDFFGRGAMVKPFEDAIFSMKAGEISNVVESDFGFHIIQMTGARGGERKSFESVKAEIVDEVSKQLAQKRYAEAAEQFSNMVYEMPESLQPVIDKLKLSRQAATVRRQAAQGATGPLASAKLLEALFSPDALKNKRNTEAVETGPNQLVSARVVEYHPERVLPLVEVRAQVLEQVRIEQAASAARKDGQARVEALKKSPEDKLPQSLMVSRTGAQGLPRQIIDAALRADVSKGAVAVGVDMGNQGFVAMKVVRQVPREATDADVERARPYVAQALAAAESAAFLEALKKRFKVEVKLPAATAAADAAASSAKN